MGAARGLLRGTISIVDSSWSCPAVNEYVFHGVRDPADGAEITAEFSLLIVFYMLPEGTNLLRAVHGIIQELLDVCS